MIDTLQQEHEKDKERLSNQLAQVSSQMKERILEKDHEIDELQEYAGKIRALFQEKLES